MARVDVLKHKVAIGEEEVFALTGMAQEAIELQEPQFTGRAAIWAETMSETYGDTVIPVTTYIENGPHRVSWIYHEGKHWQTNEEFCTHHIICDCANGVEGNAPKTTVEQLLGCRAINQALQRRAAYVDHTFRTTEIMEQLRDPALGDFEQSNAFHKFAIKSVASVLELDARHPGEWPANVLHGEHRVSVMATVLQVHPEVVKWYGRLLEGEGVIEDFDGERLKLSPEALAA